MRLPNYLQLTKNGWFRYRRAVPTDLRSHFKRPVHIVCLHTRDIEEAKKMSHAISVEFDNKVQRTRAVMEKRTATLLRTADIDHLSSRFEALLLHSDEHARSLKLSLDELVEHRELVREGAAQTADAMYAQDPEPYLDDFVDFAAVEGLRINPKWPHFDRFALAMLAAQARAYQALETRIIGKSVPTPNVPPCVRAEDDMDDIERLVLKWKKLQNVKSKTAIEIDSVVQRLRDFGNIRRVSQINETVPARFRDWLLEQGNRQRAKPGQRGTPLRVASVKKLLKLLSAAIQLAVDDKHLISNPMSGIKFPKEKDSSSARAFDVGHLNRIFASPIYTENYRPLGGAGEAAFWLPLLGLFAGGRETELGQPLLSDIRQENGVYFIEVTDKGVTDGGVNQSIKTEASRRRIPLHSKLIEIGFNEYIDWLKERGEKQLFPNLKPDCLGALLGNWSKWFNRYLDGVVGIDERGLNYHSFRHSLKYFGRVSKMPDALLDRLQGHTPDNVASTYGGPFPVGPLSETLEMLRIDGLAIDHIRWTQPTGNEPVRLKCRKR